MSKYALNIAEDGRILSATFAAFAPKNAVLIDILPEGDISEYRYVNGGYIHEPLSGPETQSQPESKVTTDDILNTLLGVTE